MTPDVVVPDWVGVLADVLRRGFLVGEGRLKS